MITSLAIENYRVFDHFSLDQIARVNLIVGTNNSGKSSLLEAIYLLTSDDPLSSLIYVLNERGEYAFRTIDSHNEKRFGGEFFISHIFHGHRPERDQPISIREESPESVSLRIVTGENRPVDFAQSPFFGDEESGQNGRAKGLVFEQFRRGQRVNSDFVPVADDLVNIRNFPRRVFSEQSSRFVATSNFASDDLSLLWDSIVLTPREEKVVDALRIIEPKVERISFTTRQKSSSGILVKMRGEKEPIPLSSMGDGMRRILTIAANLVHAEKGTLLVDEIDTGLYYGVLKDMWRLIFETALNEDAQVFATTHSGDCVRAFQEALSETPNQKLGHLVRMEKRESNVKVVGYSAAELEIAERQRIEVR